MDLITLMYSYKLTLYIQINTIEKALRAGMTTGGLSRTYNYLRANSNLSYYLMTTLLSRYHSCDPVRVCFDRVVTDRNFITLLNDATIGYYKNQYTDANGELLFRILPKRFASRPIHVVMAKVHQYRNYIGTTIKNNNHYFVRTLRGIR